MIDSSQVHHALENIYISPFKKCNLNCQLCYTQKDPDILSNNTIIDFVDRYSKEIDLKSITFCGGEIFAKPEFVNLINSLLEKNISLTIITNGTIDKLDQIHQPQNCQLLISLDGPLNIHDKNRGQGNFKKTISFIQKAITLGFPLRIMFLVSPDSYQYKDSFPQEINQIIGQKIKFIYLTQKTFYYTQNHILCNQKDTEPALTPKQIIDIKKNYNSFPNKNFGCFQLSLQPNGLVYGCSESPVSIGKITDPPAKIINRFEKSLSKCHCCGPRCHGCTNPEFMCGYKEELQLLDCDEVAKALS